ncbi:MAG: family peptidase [Verrucomicrobiota bacterium]|jgi:putative protease
MSADTQASPTSPIASAVGLRLPELLAPAGDWECAKAAVENGADAIYFGLERFNARMRAHNFTEADLPKLMEFLHRRGVKGYVTFNTLIFQNELAEAAQCLRILIAAGVDAAIVQDAGICRLIRRLSPDFPIHASTQMTVTSASGVAFARDLGCQLVVLARECSIREIDAIQKDLSDGVVKDRSLPLEVFVHGALCVAYSGQCLTSEALGGRSANRGECAQACRMPYDLICDGQTVPLGDRKYLLSPQDLAGLELLPALAASGVASLKIEGRLKTPEYVASITRVYRQALDTLKGDSRDCSPEIVRYEMEMAFSRGLSTGWFRGIDNQQLVHARFGKKRGVFIGEVGRVQGERVFVQLQGPLKAGDGIVFDAGHPAEKEEGGRVYEIQPPQFKGSNEVSLTFLREAVDFSRVKPGDLIWKTSDPELDRRLRQTFAGEQPRFQRPVDAEVHGRAGQPLTWFVRDDEGHVARGQSTMPLTTAENHPLDADRLRAQLGRLGGTPFKLRQLNNRLEGPVMLPVSELNRLRREAVVELDRQRAQVKRWAEGPPLSEAELLSIEKPPPKAHSGDPELIVLVRDLFQLDAVLKAGVRIVYCDFEDPKKYREAVARSRAESRPPGAAASEIWVAPPRIFKSGEEWTLKQVRASEADGYLVRNYDHLDFFAGSRRVGDFSLNVANALTAEHFKRTWNLERLTASYDLNPAQLEALLEGAPPGWFEVTVHQHMPMFHMEHCVFCAFLSKGTDHTNCGRPCDKHDVRLRDRVGAEHPLKADVGCRNTIFNALAQTGAEQVGRLLGLGVWHFRIEFVNETPEQAVTTLKKYGQLLRGEITGADVWRELKLLRQLGVTRGSL